MAGGSGQKGGFHFGNVGRNVDITAGGDVVSGDKITMTSTITHGFQGDGQKQQFQEQVDQLRAALIDLRAAIEGSKTLPEAKKREAAAQIADSDEALRTVKDVAAEIPAGKRAPEEATTTVQTKLERAAGIIATLKTLTESAVDLAASVGTFAAKYGPLILSSRHLFGLP
jgi:hypothetical protein